MEANSLVIIKNKMFFLPISTRLWDFVNHLLTGRT